MDRRPYAWWANWLNDEALNPPSVVFPDQVGWEQFTDKDLKVAGFDVVARKRLVRGTLVAVEQELDAVEPERLEDVYRAWGTFCAAMLLRRLTQGGKRTWRTTRGGKPGLLDLIADLERPGFVAKRAETDCIWQAQRHAWQELQDFTVDVPAKRITTMQQQALRPEAYTTTRQSREISSAELHRRVTQVFHFYGVGKSFHTHTVRGWRLHPWRLWRLDHQFEVYRDVRLAGLDWLTPKHFVPYLEANVPPGP